MWKSTLEMYATPHSNEWFCKFWRGIMPLKLRQYTVDEKVNVIQWHWTNGDCFKNSMRVWGGSKAGARIELCLWQPPEQCWHFKKEKKTPRRRQPKVHGHWQYSFWVFYERDKGRCVSNEMLMEKACGSATEQHSTSKNSKASASWLHRWKKWYQVCIQHGTKSVPETTNRLFRTFACI